MSDPITPYAGTSGWSGSDTSRERAEREDSNGTTSERQSTALGYAQTFGSEGVTVKDLRDLTGWHHGQASSTLSVLHKEGLLARLSERRDRCAVYVVPDLVQGRETAPHGRKKPTHALTHDLVKKIVTDSIYEARNAGLTIGVAAEEAAAQIMQIVRTK